MTLGGEDLCGYDSFGFLLLEKTQKVMGAVLCGHKGVGSMLSNIVSMPSTARQQYTQFFRVTHNPQQPFHGHCQGT